MIRLKRHERALMDADDEDLPAGYLYVAVVAIIAIAVAAVSAFVVLIRT